jgi:aminoglycoside phosphotransferase (APT) family kinase protein
VKRHVAESVRAALRRVWPDPATVEKAQIRALGGGVNPRTFLAVAGKQRYVLRLPTASPMALLDLATEVRAMNAAAAADLAPAVVAVDTVAGLLLTEYRSMPWTHEMVRAPIAISLIVRLLRALHALRIELPVIAIESIAARYLAELAADSASPMTTDDRRWGDELLRLARHHEASHAPTVFCHNDLVASNILTDGVAARLIDFEYAGHGTPLLDLANLAGMNDFTETQRGLLLAEYYGEPAAAPLVRELDNAIRMVRLLGYFWARLAARRVDGATAYLRLAAEIGATLK